MIAFVDAVCFDRITKSLWKSLLERSNVPRRRRLRLSATAENKRCKLALSASAPHLHCWLIPLWIPPPTTDTDRGVQEAFSSVFVLSIHTLMRHANFQTTKITRLLALLIWRDVQKFLIEGQCVPIIKIIECFYELIK